LHDNHAGYHDPSGGHVPDGIPITFPNPSWGTITDTTLTTLDGEVKAVYKANGALPLPQTPVKIYANIDNEQNTIFTQIEILQSAYLNFTKTVSKGTHYYGDTIHYYLQVKNNGPSDALDVSVFDKLPYGLTFKNVTATMGTYKLNTSTWTIGTLKVGETVKLDIKATICKVGTIKNSATLNYSTYPAKPINKTVSFTVPRAVTIPQLITASSQIKAYAESHNYRLPTSLTVAGQKLTMPQLLRLLVIATIHINKKNFNPISVTDVAKAPYPDGNIPHGNLYTNQYLTVAGNINNFIKTNGRAPNYAQTSLGKIPFTRLVYMYAKIIKFYGSNNRLPHYVYTYRLS